MEHIVPICLDSPVFLRDNRRMIFSARSVADLLQHELERRLQSNPRYSLRAFARAINMSPGELSEILREKRKLGSRGCKKLATALELSPSEYRQLLAIAARDPEEPLEASHEQADWSSVARMDEDRFRLVSDWYCFAVLNLLDVPGVVWTNADISERLGISKLEAKSAMDRLMRLGLVKRTSARTVVVNGEFVEHLTQIPSEAVRRYHRSVLEKAIAALDTQDLLERDITGVGLALDPDDLPAIKAEIAAFQDMILAKYGRIKRSSRTRIKRRDVYQLEMALFRLSQLPVSTRRP